MRAVRSVAVVFSFALLSLPSWADQALTPNQQKLTGISAYEVFVEELKPDALKCGVTQQQLKSQTELALRKNGIPVTSIGLDTLYVRLSILFDARLRSCFYFLEVWVQEFLKRDQQRILATIWQKGILEAGPSEDVPRSIGMSLAELLDLLCNDHLAANPPRKPSSK